MSEPESGLRTMMWRMLPGWLKNYGDTTPDKSEVSSSPHPQENEAFVIMRASDSDLLEEPVLGCAAVKRETQTSENVRACEYAQRHSSPTHSGLPSENDEASVSDAVFVIVHANLMTAIPTRCDYRKAAPTIYKVPKELKRGDKDEGYEPVAARVGPITGSNNGTMLLEKGNGPVAASAGPFTGNNKSTMRLESYKWCCLRRLISGRLESCSQPGRGQLDLWLKSMKRLEPKIRESYSEDIEHSSDDLAVNMLLDGCFILHRLLKYARLGEKDVQAREGIAREDDDWTQVFGRIWMWQLVACDLLLLENQIPFFVLREIFELLHSEDAPKDALVTGSLQLFRSICPPHMLRCSAEKIDYHGVHHLLHLFYLSVTSPGPTTQPRESDSKHSSHQESDLPDATLSEAPRVDEHHNVNTDSEEATVVLIDNTIRKAADVLLQWIPCAKELEEAGVRFKKGKELKSFLDIKFDSRSGVLEIPQLQLYDFSDKLFRNLIAFEQTYPDTRCDITAYAVFMDCLINTPEDMRILHLRGILVNQINGEQDATRFFSSICAQVRYWSDRNYLKEVMEEVNHYREYRTHKWRATLVRNYFSNPWVATSVLAAGFLLIMTILQTIFTAMTTFNPPK